MHFAFWVRSKTLHLRRTLQKFLSMTLTIVAERLVTSDSSLPNEMLRLCTESMQLLASRSLVVLQVQEELM